MGKTAVVLGLVISLIGGIAPRLVKADGTVDVIVRGDANVRVGFGDAKAKPKTGAGTAATQTARTKKTTKAKITKGHKTMKTINTTKNGVGKASSLPGE